MRHSRADTPLSPPLRNSLPVLLSPRQIHREAAARPAEVGGEAGEKLHFHWLKGLFEGATGALTNGLDSLCAFIGIKVCDSRMNALEVTCHMSPVVWPVRLRSGRLAASGLDSLCAFIGIKVQV